MSVRPAWEVRESGSAAMSWFDVRLAFADGARVDLLAVLSETALSIEDVRAEPPLSLDDLAVVAEWIEEPLSEACGSRLSAGREQDRESQARRARPAWPRGAEGRLLVAEEYRAAQKEGVDPVLAVMDATGHSRRKSLRLIAGARDAGFLTPRHARR
ncbi:DUF6214 family protein [Streptomyces aureus]|uniref:DUF6214 family protein n=1 Tax=Streptomyces aureus TaxID=193461 RepID=UPI00056A2CC3|nr:DUF6214 family protein [Streptomyces aureus]